MRLYSTDSTRLIASQSGEIIGYRQFSIGDPSIALYDERLIESDQPYPHETHWVNDCDEVQPRPSMPLIVSGRTITGIPAGSVLTIGEQTFQVDDGEAEIDGYAGTIKITCWPYLDAEVVV